MQSHPHLTRLVAPLALFLLAPAAPSQEKEASVIYKLLQEPIQMKDFEMPMNLKEFLAHLEKNFAARGKELPILVNVAALKEDVQDLPDPYDAELKFPEIPKRVTTATLLRLAISQIPTDPPNNAALIVRNGAVEITSSKGASLSRLLQQKVLAGYENQSLAEILDDLAEKTGVSISLDPRVADKAATKITASFRGDAILDAVLRTLSDMAGLKLVDMKSGIYITTPANAESLERALHPPKKEAEEKPAPAPPRERSSTTQRSMSPVRLHSIQHDLHDNRDPRDCPSPGTGVNPLFREPASRN